MGSPKSGSVVRPFEKPSRLRNSHFFSRRDRIPQISRLTTWSSLEVDTLPPPELSTYLEWIPLLSNRIVFMALLSILHGNSLRTEKGRCWVGGSKNPILPKTTFIQLGSHFRKISVEVFLLRVTVWKSWLLTREPSLILLNLWGHLSHPSPTAQVSRIWNCACWIGCS